jgi:hypothetical protein
MQGQPFKERRPVTLPISAPKPITLPRDFEPAPAQLEWSRAQIPDSDDQIPYMVLDNGQIYSPVFPYQTFSSVEALVEYAVTEFPAE